ncbi:MAG: tRNA uridine-5-carboxymethylaminomethyl(34) synthesis GTPase MnmE, partial [Deltaproteobacteria bacterium]
MAQSATTDTIAAIATPIGQAGIGIIRISGPESLSILKRIFRPHRPINHFKSHRLYLGHVFDPSTGLCLDEVLATYMKAPRTYTREDVVEINSHSGYFILSKILEVVIDSGARLAEP